MSFLRRTIIIVISLLQLSISSFAEESGRISTWRACDLHFSNSCKIVDAGQDLFGAGFSGYVELFSDFSRPKSCKDDDCWIFLGEIADSAQVYIDGKVLAGYGTKDNPFYLRDQSILLPLANLSDGTHDLKIIIKDLNETIFGMRTNEIAIGSYSSMRGKQMRDYMMRTGLTLITASATFFLFLALLFVSLVSRRKIDIYNCIYGLSVTLYLTSFSEVARPYMDPILAAGPLHFSLRLTQDLIFLILIMVAVRPTQLKTLGDRVLICIYALVVASLWLMYFFGVSTYRPYLIYLYIVAPLVALPSAYGLYFALKSRVRSDRIVLVPLFFVLLPFQVNDLFCFWQVYRGFFFVRIYPVLTILAFWYLSAKRSSEESLQLEADAELGRTTAGLVHDFKTPLSSLKLVASLIDDERGGRKIAYAAIDQIEQLSNSTLSRIRQNLGYESNKCQFLAPDQCKVGDVIDSINLLAEGPSFSNRLIHIEVEDSLRSKIIPINFHDFFRVLCNLIENAFESGSEIAEIDLKIARIGSKVIFSVCDTGSGIPKKYRSLIGLRGFSLKNSGNGIGLWNSKKIVETAKGTLELKANYPTGTIAELKMDVLELL